MHGLSGPRSGALILATLLFCNATLAGVLANVGPPTPEKLGVSSSSLLATRASLVAPQSLSSAATPARYEIVPIGIDHEGRWFLENNALKVLAQAEGITPSACVQNRSEDELRLRTRSGPRAADQLARHRFGRDTILECHFAT